MSTDTDMQEHKHIFEHIGTRQHAAHAVTCSIRAVTQTLSTHRNAAAAAAREL